MGRCDPEGRLLQREAKLTILERAVAVLVVGVLFGAAEHGAALFWHTQLIEGHA